MTAGCTNINLQIRETNPKDKLSGSNLSDQSVLQGGIWTSMNRTPLFIVILFWIFGWPYLVYAGDILPGDSLFVYKLDPATVQRINALAPPGLAEGATLI
jgi:hypothetical protein